jgi:hypothetical protein
VSDCWLRGRIVSVQEAASGLSRQVRPSATRPEEREVELACGDAPGWVRRARDDAAATQAAVGQRDKSSQAVPACEGPDALPAGLVHELQPDLGLDGTSTQLVPKTEPHRRISGLIIAGERLQVHPEEKPHTRAAGTSVVWATFAMTGLAPGTTHMRRDWRAPRPHLHWDWGQRSFVLESSIVAAVVFHFGPFESQRRSTAARLGCLGRAW